MKTYTVHGSRVHNRADLFAELGRAVNGPGGYFGKNLDALTDCLRGGFGTPEDVPFRFVVQDATQIESAIGEKDWAAVQEVFEDAEVELVVKPASPPRKGQQQP